MTQTVKHLRLRVEIHATRAEQLPREPRAVIAGIAAEPRRWRSLVRHDGARGSERPGRDDHDVASRALAGGKGDEPRPVEVTA